MVSTVRGMNDRKGTAMTTAWLTVKELAAIFKVSEKSIRRAYRKGEIPFERFCRCVRFDLEKVKEALKQTGQRKTRSATLTLGRRSAIGGASRRRAQPISPRLGKTGASIARTPRRKK
jgi:excisionase family DNA binding protein